MPLVLAPIDDSRPDRNWGQKLTPVHVTEKVHVPGAVFRLNIQDHEILSKKFAAAPPVINHGH